MQQRQCWPATLCAPPHKRARLAPAAELAGAQRKQRAGHNPCSVLHRDQAASESATAPAASSTEGLRLPCTQVFAVPAMFAWTWVG